MQRSSGQEVSGNRGLGEELSREQRAGILSAVEAKIPKAQIARMYRCSRPAVYKTIQRFNSTGSTKSRPRSGQPQRITSQDRRRILRIARATSKITYEAFQEELGHFCCQKTIYRVLKDSNISLRGKAV